MKRPDHVLGRGSSRDSADGDAKSAEPLRRKEMDRKLIKWAAACVLSVGSAASALAASVTSPGQTIGSAAGGRGPPGLYFSKNPGWGGRKIRPQQTWVGMKVPVLFWSTPWTSF